MGSHGSWGTISVTNPSCYVDCEEDRCHKLTEVGWINGNCAAAPRNIDEAIFIPGNITRPQFSPIPTVVFICVIGSLCGPNSEKYIPICI